MIFSKIKWEKMIPSGYLNICLLVAQTVREGNGTPLQYSCLENPMDGGAL